MGSGLRVLVIDDDPDFLQFAREGLGGAEVDVARTPLEALWILERKTIDAVLCDLVLAHSDGLDLLEAVRVRWPQATRVLVTGFSDRLGDDHATPTAQAVVRKPCDLGELRQLLTALA